SGSDTPPNAMEALNSRLDKVMRKVTKERTQHLATEETLRRTQARLDTQQHPSPAQPNPAPAPNPIKLTKPQPFDGTRGAAAERFPTDASKVAFTTLFMRDYTATWCQPYLNRIFNGEPLDWTDFLKDLEASFFDHNRQQRAEVALRNIRQTGTV
ncbi:uncharacterized protein VP01_11306g1, partial [Puccinia sorghi]